MGRLSCVGIYGSMPTHGSAKAKQQEKKAVTELSGADRAAVERCEKERFTGSSVRRRTEEGERVGPAPSAAGGTSATAAGNTRREQQKSRPAPPAAGGTSEAAAVRLERGSRPDKSAPPAAGGTGAAAADKSERSCGKGKLTPSAAGGTSATAVSKPEQVSRPAKPALPVAGETKHQSWFLFAFSKTKVKTLQLFNACHEDKHYKRQNSPQI
jgi:hypothetical protein